MPFDPFAVFRHGVRSVLHNAGASLRLCWPWLIIFVIVYGVLAYIIAQSGFGTTPLEPERGAGTFAFGLLIGALVYAVGVSSIAVSWHRYVLRDEMPGVGQRLRVDGVVFRYLGRGLAAGFLTVLMVIVPYALVAGILGRWILDPAIAVEDATKFQFTAPFIAAWLVMIVFAAVATAILFRFSLALPAAALERNEIGLFDSWGRTRGMFGALLVVAGCAVALQAVAQLVIDVVAGALGSAHAILGMAVSGVLTLLALWFFSFLGITLLTTLYGHIVENRRL